MNWLARIMRFWAYVEEGLPQVTVSVTVRPFRWRRPRATAGRYLCGRFYRAEIIVGPVGALLSVERTSCGKKDAAHA